jgi:hypothetical protein
VRKRKKQGGMNRNTTGAVEDREGRFMEACRKIS